MGDRLAIEQLVKSLRSSIAHAEASADANPAVARALQRVLALLWSAHDEVELLSVAAPVAAVR